MAADAVNTNQIVVGCDNGDGNIAIYTSVFKNGGDPTPVKALQEEMEASVYAVYNDGSYLWGNSLKEMAAEDLPRVQRFMVNFKAIPGTGNDEYMREFASMVREAAENNTNNFNGLTPVWFVGCPSSWHQHDVTLKEKYADIFRKAGFGKVVICEESTAALAFYDRALKAVTKNNVSFGILLIDWGSSTLDATFIYPPQDGESKMEACGCALGAQYIEKTIVYATLYTPQKYGLDTMQDQNLVAKVRAEYEKDEKFRTLLHTHARILKETYFKAMAKPGMKPAKNQIKWTETVTLASETSRWGQGNTFFRMGVSIAMMDSLLNAPLSEILPDFSEYNEFTRKDLEGHSFISRNDSFLEMLANKYTQYKDAKDALIVLTGGASQMDFVRDAVKRYFPNHKIDYDTAPELSIGKGLTYYGKEALHNAEFEHEFEELSDKKIKVESLENPVAQLLWTLWDCYTDLVWDVTVEMQKQCAVSVLSAVQEWMDAKIQCEQINQRASDIYAKWAKDELPRIKSDSQKKYTTNMRTRINEMYVGLLKKYNIKATMFNGEVSPELLDFLNTTFDKMAKSDEKFLLEFLKDQFISLGNGPKFMRKGKINVEKLTDILKTQLENWINLEYGRFTQEEFLETVIAYQYWEVKKELDSKKESILFQLGLMQSVASTAENAADGETGGQ